LINYQLIISSPSVVWKDHPASRKYMPAIIKNFLETSLVN